MESFATSHLGPVTILGQPATTGASRVLHVRDADGAGWFVKRSTTPGPFRRERAGLLLWGHLPAVPTLRAACGRRRCVLVPELAGRQPASRSIPALRAAGEVLRSLHDTEAKTWDSRWRELAVTDTDRRLSHLARVGIEVDQRLVREHTEALVALSGIAEVPTHGDFQPHNWRWRRGRLGVFDFAASGLRPAAFDLGRLHFAACWGRPRRFAAVVRGYGRDLTAVEWDFVRLMLPWRAVVALSYGARHRRPEMVEHGLDVLAAVADGRDRPGG